MKNIKKLRAGIKKIKSVHIFIAGILLLNFYLNTYKLSTFLTFIGDQAWFYLSARDIILTGRIPLVGIASSHPWLHQGALWTYMLSFALWIGRFNPVSGAYLTAVLGTLSVLILYLTTSRMFSQKIGIISAILYATSPLVIINSRFAYHTSPIPLFVMFFLFFLYKWISGKSIYFPLIIFTLGILYSLELATCILAIAFLVIFAYGLYRKRNWAISVFNKKIFVLTFAAFTISMFPILIYDVTHGYVQTIGFVVWIAYSLVKPLLSIAGIANVNSENNILFFQFLVSFIKNLVFMPSAILAILLFLASFLSLLLRTIKTNNSLKLSYKLFFALFCISSLGLLFSRIPSDAYLPMFYPMIIILISISFSNQSKRVEVFLVSLIAILNVLMFYNYNFIKNQDLSFIKRSQAVDKIVNLADGKSYNLIGKKKLGYFPSYIMNYEYIAWLKGNEPSKNNVSMKIFITEEVDRIIVEKSNSTN